MVGCGFLALTLAAVLFGLASLVKSCKSEGASKGASTPASFEEDAEATPQKEETKTGLALEDLEMTSAPISGYWKEEDLAVDDEQRWIGSTCVVARDKGNIYLLTNRHCLGLEELSVADDDGYPEVINYGLQIHFPGNVIRQVKSFGILHGDVDLAWLVVDGTGVTQTIALGMPNEKLPPMRPGLDVVVVGSPIDLELRGSHTFGRISALRPYTDGIGHEVQLIQTDAAINHGNSGGPMFVKSSGRYTWVGVAVARVDAADNLGLAIGRDTVMGREEPMWFSADPSGVIQLFNAWR